MERGARERSAGGRGLLRLGALLLLLLLLPGPGVRTRRSGWEGGRDPGRREGHRGRLAVSPGLPGKGRGGKKKVTAGCDIANPTEDGPRKGEVKFRGAETFLL